MLLVSGLSLILVLFAYPVTGRIPVQSESGLDFNSTLGHAIAGGWQVGGRAQALDMITLHIFVSHDPLSKRQLEQHLLASSDPASPRYGQHMNFEDMNQLLRPPTEARKAVVDWLASAGVNHSENRAGDIIEATLPVHAVERLLQAEYYTLTHPVGGRSIKRTARYTLPANVARFVDAIGPTTRLPYRPVPKALNATCTHTRILIQVSTPANALTGTRTLTWTHLTRP